MPKKQKCIRECGEEFTGNTVEEVAEKHEAHLREKHADVSFKDEQTAAAKEIAMKERENELAQQTVNMLEKMSEMTKSLVIEQDRIKEEAGLGKKKVKE